MHRCAKPQASNAVQNYIIAAIIGARDGYDDPNWQFWAENWLNGRDRSYESAALAHRQAREVCERLTVGASGADDETLESFSDEVPAERAAWAAGLALVNAPMGPDLTGSCLRFEAAVKRGVARILGALAPSTTRWAELLRYVGALS